MELQLLTSPPDVDGAVEPIIYTINLDTTGDGQPDYTVTYQNDAPGHFGWVATLVDRISGTQLFGPSFPGTVNVTKTAVDLVVSLDAIGVPPGHAQIDAAAVVQRSFLPDGTVDADAEQSTDRAPDQQWPGHERALGHGRQVSFSGGARTRERRSWTCWTVLIARSSRSTC